MNHKCLSVSQLQSLLNDEFIGPDRRDAELHFRECGACQAFAEEFVARMSDESFVNGIELNLGSEESGHPSSLLIKLNDLRSKLLPSSDFFRDVTRDVVPPRTAVGQDMSSGEVADPLVIGPYHLREVLGHGGFGMVYRAEQYFPLRRTVALKLIKPGMDSQEVIARFDVERQAVSMMDHPHIAQVLDAGMTPNGRPFFVMELVAGLPVTQYCEAYRVPLRERLQIFIDICEAVQHAHQKGIIHRDLKPSNVLVRERDNGPEAKVIDFGIAKALTPTIFAGNVMTSAGRVIGTTLYMSPEQVSAASIDTRSDIFSLGVLFYQLLTGTTPIEESQLQELGQQEIMRLIREQVAPKPSSRLISLKERQQGPEANTLPLTHNWHRQIRGGLDWIALKSLDKDPDRRYTTPKDFAADIQRYLAYRPVLACPPSATYLLRTTVRRHWALIASLAIIFISLSTGTAVAVVQAARATSEGLRAETEAAVAKLNAAEATKEKQRADEQTLMAEAMVDTFFTEFVEKHIRDEPGTLHLHKAYLLAALDFYSRLSKTATVDEENALKQAETLRRGAVLNHILGNDREADLAFNRAIEGLSALKMAGEQSEAAVLRKSECELEYGRYLYSRDNLLKAKQMFERALNGLAAIETTAVITDTYLHLRALLHQQLGQTYLHANNSEGSKHLVKSIDDFEKLIQRDPIKSAQYGKGLAETLLYTINPMAQIPNSTLRLQFTTAKSLLDSLVQSEPSPSNRFLMARLRLWYVERQYKGFTCDESPEMNDLIVASVKDLWDLVAESPEDQRYQTHLVYAQIRSILYRVDSPAAQKSCDALVAHVRTVQSTRPMNDQFAANLGFVLNHMAMLQFRRQNFAEALGSAEEALAFWERIIASDKGNPWWCRERLKSAYIMCAAAKWNLGKKALAVSDLAGHVPLLLSDRNNRTIFEQRIAPQPLMAELTLLYSDTYAQDLLQPIHQVEGALFVKAFEKYLTINTSRDELWTRAQTELGRLEDFRKMEQERLRQEKASQKKTKVR